MNTTETQKLLNALANLATVMTDTIAVRIADEFRQQKPAIPPTVIHGNQPQSEQIVTKKQLAELFQVSARTIDNWISKGFIPHYRIGRCRRFPINQILAHLDGTLLLRGRPSPRRLQRYVNGAKNQLKQPPQEPE